MDKPNPAPPQQLDGLNEHLPKSRTLALVRAESGLFDAASSAQPSRPSLLHYPHLKRRLDPNVIWLSLAGSVMLLFLLIPILALLFRSVADGAIGAFLTTPAVVEALRLSLITTALTLGLAIVLGTPLAYLLARHRFPGYGIIDTFWIYRWCCRPPSPESRYC